MPRRPPLAAVLLPIVGQGDDAAPAARELREAAQRLGYDVAITVRETRRETRPGLRRTVAAARRREIEAVFAWKLDSLGATAANVQQTFATFADLGTRVVVTSHGLDFRPGESNVVGELMLRMLAAISEFESDQNRLRRQRTRERAQLGIARAREQGKQLGRPRVERPDPARVFRLRKQRKSWPAIAELLGVSRHAARTALPPGTDPMLDVPAPSAKKGRAKHTGDSRRKRQRSARRR
jgi:DNA invertase Pin-like site-specific DNA recombinase